MHTCGRVFRRDGDRSEMRVVHEDLPVRKRGEREKNQVGKPEGDARVCVLYSAVSDLEVPSLQGRVGTEGHGSVQLRAP